MIISQDGHLAIEGIKIRSQGIISRGHLAIEGSKVRSQDGDLAAIGAADGFILTAADIARVAAGSITRAATDTASQAAGGISHAAADAARAAAGDVALAAADTAVSAAGDVTLATTDIASLTAGGVAIAAADAASLAAGGIPLATADTAIVLAGSVPCAAADTCPGSSDGIVISRHQPTITAIALPFSYNQVMRAGRGLGSYVLVIADDQVAKAVRTVRITFGIPTAVADMDITAFKIKIFVVAVG